MTTETRDLTRCMIAANRPQPSEQGPCIQILSKPCVLAARVDDLGYGRSSKGGFAHRDAYEAAYGPIPDSLEVDHLCNERACVEPTHLELVTHAENCRRRFERVANDTRSCVPRSKVAGECSRGHALTDDNVYVVPATGRKQCRTCRGDRMAEHKDRVATAAENKSAAKYCPDRPTLDAVVEALCSDIRNRARLHRPLPLPKSAARVDELVGAATGARRPEVVR